MSNFRVTATSLNLRSEPQVAPRNILAVLNQGQIVAKVADSPNPNWWQVKATVGGTDITGYVNHSYLAPADGPAPQPQNALPKAHMPTSSTARRSSTSGRAFPLGEQNMPRRDTPDPAKTRAVIDWLNVDASNRYLPTGGQTFCNIYAYDACYLMNVYLPRVWWTSNAIVRLRNGENVPVQYGTTVRELNANALTEWLEDFGASYGWRLTTSLDELQKAVNEGKVGLICAQRTNLNRSGHIVMIAPEHGAMKATKRNNKVFSPLQSQAGASNHQYWTYNDRQWWLGNQFRKFGFWIHD